MTSHIPAFKPQAIYTTPVRGRRVMGADLVAGPMPSRLILPAQKPGTILLAEYPVFGIAYNLPTIEVLDEEVELCWPLSKESSGPPGPELGDFKRFHHRVWKRFESAEDLMTDEYLEARPA